MTNPSIMLRKSICCTIDSFCSVWVELMNYIVYRLLPLLPAAWKWSWFASPDEADGGKHQNSYYYEDRSVKRIDTCTGEAWESDESPGWRRKSQLEEVPLRILVQISSSRTCERWPGRESQTRSDQKENCDCSHYSFPIDAICLLACEHTGNRPMCKVLIPRIQQDVWTRSELFGQLPLLKISVDSDFQGSIFKP
jgi:hypothetical protein